MEASSSSAAAPVKLQKTKYAIQFGYCGANYHGLQSNNDPNNVSIEDVLLGAFHKAGLISAENMDDPLRKAGWQRASRTDKGVSALRNLASAKLCRQPDGEEGAVARVNEHLPSDIRLYGLQPVTASFSSHLHCTGREYEYYLPTFALLRHDEFVKLMPAEVGPVRPTAEDMNADPAPRPFTNAATRNECVAPDDEGADDADEDVPDRGGSARDAGARNKKQHRAEGNQSHPTDGDNTGVGIAPATGPSEKFFMYRSCPPPVADALRRFRLTPEGLQRARSLFSMYEGTIAFHNFTPKGKPTDPKTTRFMRKIRVSDPFLVFASKRTGEMISEAEAKALPPSDVYELEFVRIELDGQSFMLNQIRKMIGTVLGVMAANLDGGYLRSCLEKSTMRVTPMAPANGLFLVNLFFDRYNFTLERIQGEGSNASDRRPVVMADVPADRVDQVRNAVLASIVREELAHDVYGRWIRGLRFVVNQFWSIQIP